MAEPVIVVVVPVDTGDSAESTAVTARCLAALSKTEAESSATITALRTSDVVALDELLRTHTNGFAVLLDADTEPLPGFLDALLANHVHAEDVIRVSSPSVRGVLDWPPLPSDWGPTSASLYPRHAVMFAIADWPTIFALRDEGLTSLPGAVIDAADHHHIVEGSIVLGHRPTTIARDLNRRLPRFDINRCARAILLASAAELNVARTALYTWLELAASGIREASTSLVHWRALRASLSPKELSCLPRWMTVCDQHAQAIIEESLLCPAAVDSSRTAVSLGDVQLAKDVLRRFPDSYCAAVAVMSLAPESATSHVTYTIPRVIVQAWFDSDVPEDAKPLIADWIRLHPGWEHRMFTSVSAEHWLTTNIGADAAAIFRSAPPVAKSNLFRYAYLLIEGGIWSDIDDRPIACIESLVDSSALVVLRESLGAIGDNFIAVTPTHPVLQAAFEESFRNERDGYGELQWLANGPAMFTRKVAGWIAASQLPSTNHLSYRVVSGVNMVDFISVHEDLAYKSTPLAWDAEFHRRPERDFANGDVPQAHSVRQQSLRANDSGM